MDATRPLKPIFNYNPSNTVLLLVGEKQEEMLVHAGFLSARSKFFKAALSNNWQEGQTKLIKLPEDDPETVGQYLDHLYRKILPMEMEWSANHAEAIYFALARLYAYGERVLDRDIRDSIAERFVIFTSVINLNLPRHLYYPGPGAIEIIYEGTTEASPMRRLLVDMYVLHGSKEWLVPKLHPEFCQDVAREFMRRAEDGVHERSGKMMSGADYYID